MAIRGKSSAMAGDFRPGAVSRRALLVGVMASACGRTRGKRYQGWLFVASSVEKEIAVADLASFRRVASIPLPCAPDQLFQSRGRVFAICRDARAIVEIDVEQFRFAARIGLPGKPVAVRLLPEASAANNVVIVLADNPSELLAVDLPNRRVTARLALAGAPGDLDLNGTLAAITLPAKNAVVRAFVPAMKLAGATDVGVSCGAVRFRRDGRTILAGATAARQIVAVDALSGKFLTRLPLPVSPSRFCFNADGGQMFVTGTGEDALAIVSPFQNEVAETILAGRTPYGMAVSERRNLLFVTNPGSGDLTILDIETRGLSASVHVGETPGDVLLTPDGEYALVLDQHSGSVSVVRIPTVLGRKVKTNPLFTVFPTAAGACSAIIVPFQQT
jgi:YVTN family beta-propeller protein